MSKPAGHVPPITRYTARVDGAADQQLVALFVGVQSESAEGLAASSFDGLVAQATALPDAPAYVDLARFVDPANYHNHLAAMYWPSRRAFLNWADQEFVREWRGRPHDGFGSWWEPAAAHIDRLETIAFEQFLRGVSACPFSRLEQTGESGYWGAARDRIPASAYNELAGTVKQLLYLDPLPRTRPHTVRIKPPAGLAVIRSGVSWEACDSEQLDSYERNVRPKLDAGMAYLTDHPLESGCCSLRQVTARDVTGAALKEAYSLGAFISLKHLEDWSRHHPTHLAIYHRAMMERRKYQESLQLRTYNEIYVLGSDALAFEYINCHVNTGLLRFFAEEK